MVRLSTYEEAIGVFNNYRAAIRGTPDAHIDAAGSYYEFKGNPVQGKGKSMVGFDHVYVTRDIAVRIARDYKIPLQA